MLRSTESKERGLGVLSISREGNLWSKFVFARFHDLFEDIGGSGSRSDVDDVGSGMFEVLGVCRVHDCGVFGVKLGLCRRFGHFLGEGVILEIKLLGEDFEEFENMEGLWWSFGVWECIRWRDKKRSAYLGHGEIGWDVIKCERFILDNKLRIWNREGFWSKIGNIRIGTMNNSVELLAREDAVAGYDQEPVFHNVERRNSMTDRLVQYIKVKFLQIKAEYRTISGYFIVILAIFCVKMRICVIL
jgi:hypothetical protein